jgi:hypothetical protein
MLNLLLREYPNGITQSTVEVYCWDAIVVGVTWVHLNLTMALCALRRGLQLIEYDRFWTVSLGGRSSKGTGNEQENPFSTIFGKIALTRTISLIV